MKVLKPAFILFCFFLLVLSSCTIEKRHYRAGYHINKHGSGKETKATVPSGISKEDHSATAKLNNESKYKLDDDSIDRMMESASIVSDEPNPDTRNASEAKTEAQIPPINKRMKLAPDEMNASDNKLAALVNPKGQQKYKKRVMKAEEWNINSNLAQQFNTLGLIGMIFGIAGCLGYYCGPLLGLTGVIISLISMSKSRKNPGEYGQKGFALAGLITGAVAFVFWTLYLIFVVLLVSSTYGY